MKHSLLAIIFVASTQPLAADDFPPILDTETKLENLLTPEAALQKMKLPDGFQVTLAAAEPEIRNPIAMAWDGRGRLWVAECFTYAERAFDLSLRDRILIFEDSDGDGRFDSRKVFSDELQQVTSLEIGHGGVWVTAAPRLLFVPDADGDDKPDGPPVAHLDGFRVPTDSYHNLVNGLRFGPDGWLYGRCGATGTGDVGVPGTPAADLIPVRGGMWRYQPERHVFEAITSGNTNPWGHDWNEHGELFYVNTVNGHFWHAIPGAHFVRAHTIDQNSHVYSLIDMHADHWHFDTKLGWQDAARRKDNNLSDSLGGGHVHIGAMFYLADNWPEAYRGEFFTLNQHGSRANQEHVERHGSGYIARHRPDFFKTGDEWFLGLELRYGPDGGVFVIDWSDTGECHERDGVHRNSGRIFKITHGRPDPVSVDLGKLSPSELVALNTHANEWFPRQARVELSSRQDTGNAASELLSLLEKTEDPVIKLRALWTLYNIGGADEKLLKSLLAHENEHIRVWALRLLTDAWPLDTLMSNRPANFGEIKTAAKVPSPESILSELVTMAREDESSLVRLTLASILQRLPVENRVEVAAELVQHEEDSDDHNIPLMIWYGLIPVAEAHPEDLVRISKICKIPTTRLCIARRLAEDIESRPSHLNELLEFSSSASPEVQSDILNGMSAALTGWRKAEKPAHWDTFSTGVSNDPALANIVRDLSALFGDGRALDEVKRIAFATDVEMDQRIAALKTLIENRPPDLKKICAKLINERFINPVAATGLAQFDDPDVAETLVKAYRRFHHTERSQLIEVLTSRPNFALALLDEVERGTIPRDAISAFHVRQMRNLNDETLATKLAAVWGEMRESSAEKLALMEKLTRDLDPATLEQADKSAGRQIFNASCSACHRLHGFGNAIGPDLTGAGRDSLFYLLENIIDPGAQVAADFRLNLVTLNDGRVVSGFIRSRNERTLTIQTLTGEMVLELSEISKEEELPVSMMPEGLIAAFSPDQIRDLFAYLMHPGQVPLPEE